MIYDRPGEITGATVFTRLPGLCAGFDSYLKLESLNPAGSIKLKTARSMLARAEHDGLARPGTHFIESTSGNLGIALASLCAARGYRLTLVTDPNTNRASTRHMQALGAAVVVVSDLDRNGGYLESRLRHLRVLLAANPGLVWLNQYANTANSAAHCATTAAEILSEFGAPEWLLVGVGTSGTLMGCVQGFAAAGARTRIVAVDADGSVNFAGPPGRRRVPGLGASVRPELLVDNGSFDKVIVTEPAAIKACRRVARDYGLLVGGSTGSLVAAVDLIAPRVRPGSRVLMVSPDLGDRYLDTLYDDTWVESCFGPNALNRSLPIGRVMP